MFLNENSLIETVFDLMPFAVYVVDVNNFEIIHMNKSMMDLRGNRKGELCHNAIYQDDTPCMFCKIHELLDEKNKPNGESCVFEHFDDIDDCWYQIQEKAIVWPDGRIVKCSILVDISELKAAQNHLAEAHAELALKNKALESASRHKSAFLASMSHEIKTPLHAVIGLSDLILKTDLTLRQKDYARKINATSNTMLAILNDILDLSRVEAGRIELEHIPFNLSNVIDDISTMFKYSAVEKGIRLLVSMDNDVPLFLMGDPLRLGQILSNLLSNAVKFTYSGQIVTHVGLVKKKNKKALIRFSVTDTGIGISQDILPGLFRYFNQGDASTTRKHGGSGLGLNICKKLIDLMGGSISVKSNKKRGSTFSFELFFDLQQIKHKENLLHPADRAKKKSPPLPPSGPNVSYAPDALQGINILLVDDQPINRQVAQEILTFAGARVKAVSNGKAAVAAAKTSPFDVILMDVNMPGMDGYQTTRAIRRMGETSIPSPDPSSIKESLQNNKKDNEIVISHGKPRLGNTGYGLNAEIKSTRVPIIAMTVHSSEEEKIKCLAAGMDYFTTKFNNPDQLYDIILKWCGKKIPDKTSSEPDGVQPFKESSIMPGMILDTGSGIKRVRGNRSLYRELLMQYIKQSAAVPRQMRKAVKQGHLELAANMAHSLKGVSGNIGAERVFLLTMELENAIKNKVAKDCIRLLDQLKTTLSNTNNAIKDWIEKDKIESQNSETIFHGTSSENGIKLASALNGLKILLESNNAKAMEHVKVIEKFNEIAQLKYMDNMKKLIKELEFEKALDVLKHIAHKLDVLI